MCTHTYVSTHYFMFGACWGTPRLQRTFLLLLLKCMALWLSYGTPLRFVLSSELSLLVWQTVSPILRMVYVANFVTTCPLFALLMLLKLNQSQSLKNFAHHLLPALYHPFQRCTIPSSPPCWHFPFKHPYSCYMACTYSSQNKIISWVAV